MNLNRIKTVIVVYANGSRGKSMVLRMLCAELGKGENKGDHKIRKEDSDVVFVAVRKQEHRDGLGDCDQSFPLTGLEDLERRFALNVVRPFVSINYQTNKPSSSTSQQVKNTFIQRSVATNTPRRFNNFFK